MSLRLIIGILTCTVINQALAAEVWLAKVNGNTVGIVIEGEIASGDFARVRDAIRAAGPGVGTVYLRSQGGDVLESIKIGELLRRLRLETDAPLRLPGREAQCFEATPKTSADCVCASACFLVFAAGSNRHGNHLGLHRPYLRAGVANSMSEAEHDKIHRDISERVRTYLLQMDTPTRFIDLMLSRSSRQIYFVDIEEAERDGLMGRVASTEEYLIAKCAKLSLNDERSLEALRAKDRAGMVTDADRRRGREIGARLLSDLECNTREMRSVRANAFEQEFR